MKAVVYDSYGSADVLSLQDIDRPTVKNKLVLVRIVAASVNPLDWHFMTGLPYLTRTQIGLRAPKQKILGVDLAGVVEQVGPEVTEFKPGDEVFGWGAGTFAEYAATGVDQLAHKPASLTFEQAAAVPIAGLTALQGLRDKGKLTSGQSVLINGAAGGVGTFAIQIAKSFGAEVTAVCSTGNVERVRALGADHVIDYTEQDFATGNMRYDLILDNVGNRSPADCKRVMKPSGMLVIIGGPKKGKVLGPIKAMIRALASFRFAKQSAVAFIASQSKDDLLALAQLVESGEVVPSLDRSYDLSETAEALRYLGTGHARAKLIIKP